MGRGLQCGQHVTGANAVDTDSGVRPFDGETRSQVPHCSLCSVIRRLRLWHIHDSAGHGTYQDHTALGLAVDQMPCDFAGEEVCSIHINAPQFSQAIRWVCDCVEIFGEAGGGYQVVYFAMDLDNFRNCGFDRLVVRDVAVVGCNLGDTTIVLV